MRKKFWIATIVSCLVILVSPVSGQRAAGRIVGTVLDEKGSPVSNARVTAHFDGVAVLHTIVPTADTDIQGRFKIERLNWGPYTVYAGKESDGYPNGMLYKTRGAPTVTLSPNSPVGRVVVRIGPRGGVLVASVRDALTGEPLPSQLILQRKGDSGQLGLSEPPDFQVLLPAETDFSIEIRKPGYKPWAYNNVVQRWARLKAGERLVLSVPLAALADNSKH